MLRKTSLILVFAMAQIGCVSPMAESHDGLAPRATPSDEYAAFVVNLETGDKMLSSGDFDKAETNFQEANKIATKHHWINETVSSTTELGKVSVARRDLTLAEKYYTEAVRICQSSPECDVDQLDVAVSYLNLFYVFRIKTPGEAAAVLTRLDSSDKCASGECDKFICEQWSWIASSGGDASQRPEKCKRR